MELLLLLYAMLAGLAGVSGQGPSRAHEVALGSTAAVEIAERGAEAAVATKAIAATRAKRALGVVRVVEDARRIDAPLTVLALVPRSRQAPERRLE